MKICPNCSKELADDAKFCDGCGTKVPEVLFCPNCGKQARAGAAFCQNCGTSLTETSVVETEPPVKEMIAAEPSVAETPVTETPTAETTTTETPVAENLAANVPTDNQPTIAPKIKKKLPQKAFIFGGIGAAIVALIVAFFLFSKNWLPDIIKPSKPAINYALFLKDKEIFFTDFKEDSSPWQLTAKLNDTGDSIDSKEFAEIASYLGRFTYMSEDGKYVFFPDKVGDEDDGFNLYYREVNTPEAESIKIDSDVQSYIVNSDATIITYLKGESDDLYQYKMVEDSKDKIASGVVGFEVSDDGTKIGYIDSESNLYLKYADKEKEKIASEISSLEYVTKDFKTAYYVKDGSLYKQVEGEDKEKIASDILDVLKVYDTGEIYYVLTGESTDKNLIDYVDDDMKDADAALVEPVFNEPAYPTYPDYNDYNTWDAYYAAQDAYYEAQAAYYDKYQVAWEEYNAAYDLYETKLSRDELREQLQTNTINLYSYSLCFFDGKETTVLTDVFTATDYQAGGIFASDSPVIFYRVYNPTNVKKVNFSEITDIDSAKSLVQQAMSASYDRYIAAKGSATLIEPSKDTYDFRINDSGTVAYYIDNLAEGEEYGELYRISIDDGIVEKPELYDSDVYRGLLGFISNNQIKYFKEYDENKLAGDLYINKNRIDYEVMAFSIDIPDTSDKIFYATDWNIEKECGTLKVYEDEKAVKIADDVHDYSVTPAGQVLYLYDYSMEYYRGELREWNNGETQKIADDVISILPADNSKYRGFRYSW